MRDLTLEEEKDKEGGEGQGKDNGQRVFPSHKTSYQLWYDHKSVTVPFSSCGKVNWVVDHLC